MIASAPEDKEVIVAGGFLNEQEVQSSQHSTNLSALCAAHEEGDTRLVLHGIENNSTNIVVSARDTDVLLLLVSHFPHFTCQNLWMKSGTAKKPKYIYIKDIFNKLPPQAVQSLLPFHALTGCDTTSFICSHTKHSAWKVFLKHHNLLSGLGEGELTEDKIKLAEKFVCRLYSVDHVDSVDMARYIIFSKVSKPEAMPPTTNALHYHIKRAHFQSMIWKQAHCSEPDLPAPEMMGWKLQGDKLEPVLMTLPAIPKACLEVISCSCRTGCRNFCCRCRKSKLFCTAVCGCNKYTARNACVNVNPT